MNEHMISPLDGRYWPETRSLSPYFSDFALNKYRLKVEIDYFFELVKATGLQPIESDKEKLVRNLENLTQENYFRIKKIEETTKHDIKAIEMFLREEFEILGLSAYKEFIHLGLTSQDVNNTATPLMLRDFLQDRYYSEIEGIIKGLNAFYSAHKTIPMLAHTHGQPAVTTSMGKELKVFSERLRGQVKLLKSIPINAKFGGAVGNLSALNYVFPEVDWVSFSERFINQYGLKRTKWTTQIEPYDNLCGIFDNIRRINNILLDFCRDMWQYISMEYFSQKFVSGEVGSSTMPQKINPINFENAEGNLGIANAILSHFSNKLQISRLQRDLSDSTVLRNIGVPLAHTILAIANIKKGFYKVSINLPKIRSDIENNWCALMEPVQLFLRKEGYEDAYLMIKEKSRGGKINSRKEYSNMVKKLDIHDTHKAFLLNLTPSIYCFKKERT